MILWYAVTARFATLACLLRGHFVDSWVSQDLPICPGDIVCHTCNVVHWCRAHDPWMPQLRGN